jgi:hypothetical protein
LPPMSNCLGFLRKSKTALEVTPGAAFSTDGTAAAMFVLLEGSSFFSE